MSFLYGGLQHVVDGIQVIGVDLKRGVIERLTQLLADPKNLYNLHRMLTNAHPTYGSWEGHQDALRGQQSGLRRLVNEWRARCGGPGGGGASQAVRNVIATANDWSTRPVPAEPRTAGASGQPQPLYTVVLEGETRSGLSAAQALDLIRAAANRFARRVETQSGEHQLMIVNNAAHPVLSWVAEGLGGADMPSQAIWVVPRTLAQAALAACASGDVNAAASQLARTATTYRRAYERYSSYKDDLFKGGDRAVLGAEVVAVGCAVVFVAAAAAVAIPAAAGAGAGAGAVGAGAGATTSAAGVGAGAAGVGAGATGAGGAAGASLIVATDSAVASTALGAAASSVPAVSPALMNAAAEAMVWTAEEVQMTQLGL